MKKYYASLLVLMLVSACNPPSHYKLTPIHFQIKEIVVNGRPASANGEGHPTVSLDKAAITIMPEWIREAKWLKLKLSRTSKQPRVHVQILDLEVRSPALGEHPSYIVYFGPDGRQHLTLPMRMDNSLEVIVIPESTARWPGRKHDASPAGLDFEIHATFSDGNAQSTVTIVGSPAEEESGDRTAVPLFSRVSVRPGQVLVCGE